LELEKRRLDFLTRRFKKAIMSSKSREESEWDYDPAEPGPVRRCFLIALSIMFVVGVLSCGVVGHAIGKAIVPSGYGFDGRAGGGVIGATLGSSLGIGLGTITGMYVSHYLCARKELKARKSQCTSKIAQLQNAIQSKSEQVLRGDESDSDRMANTFDIPPYYDSRRCVAYNEQLGLGGEDDLGSSQSVTPVGASFPTSLRSHAPASSSTTPKFRVGVWVCSRCGSRQSVNVRYCKQCGYQLGINCPQCDTLILSDSKFCPNCATKVQEAIQQKEFEETQRKRAQQEAARHRAQQQAEEQERAKRRERVKVQMGILGCVLGAIAGPIAWAIIWPRVMASTIGVIAQIVMGAIGGVVANLWIVDSWNDPLQEKAGLGLGIIGGIVGGIVAFPVIVIGLLSQLLA
jgi:ribosomal protein L40E